MALADNPREHILHMFKMEMRGGNDHDCQIFLDGITLDKLPLESDEKVFGVFKEKFFFTPSSLIWYEDGHTNRLEWNKVKSCSSAHGSGQSKSRIELVDGTKFTLPLNELAKGWSGRIGQLYHAMIEKWRVNSRDEHWVLNIDSFFELAKSSDAIAPNWYPDHPGLKQMRAWLEKLENRPDVSEVLLIVSDYDTGEPSVREIALVGESIEVDADIENMKFSSFGPALERTLKIVGPITESSHLTSGIWH